MLAQSKENCESVYVLTSRFVNVPKVKVASIYIRAYLVY